MLVYVCILFVQIYLQSLEVKGSLVVMVDFLKSWIEYNNYTWSEAGTVHFTSFFTVNAF